ncbi:MAG: DNA topoisomerase IV subunit A [bacterium]|nr:DNA topoisomerase IV subunit A [bacterium]
MKEQEVLEKVKELAKRVADDILAGRPPKIEFATRGSRNIEYDERRDLILIGERTTRRKLLDLGETRKFLQTVKVLELAYRHLVDGRHSTIREVYYQLKYEIPGTDILVAQKQAETDNVMFDLEVALGVLREQLHFLPKRKGAVVGPITLIDRSIPGEVQEIDCTKAGRGGIAIPSTIEETEIYLQKDKEDVLVLAIETGGMFERLLEERFWKAAYNKLGKDIILVLTEGQPSRATRRLLHRLHAELGLEVYVFTDGDPWGFYIYSVIKRGSMRMSYLSEQLAVPSARFVGMLTTDIYEYHLESRTEPLKKRDIKRLQEELQYPWFKKPAWQHQLMLMLQIKKRIEQQALAAHGLEFVAKEYLPEKILENKVLD